MNRRNFLSWVGVGALATSLPVALAACNSEADNVTTEESSGGNAAPEPEPMTTASAEAADTSSPEDGFVAVGAVSTLDEQGFLASEELPGGPVIVVRDPNTPETLIALDSRCPHRGCAVEWEPADSQLVCPCHQSVFEPDGSLVSGPATTSLEAYEVDVNDGQVLVKTT